MSYLLTRLFGALLAFLPYQVTYALSFPLGALAYLFASELRKTALSNLQISDLGLNPKQVRRTARRAFYNLALTCLEYPHLSRRKGAFKWARCMTPEVFQTLTSTHKNAVFLSAHQANWEIPFIDLCTRCQAEAIGRPLKNPKLDAWVVRIRESTGGKIWPMQNAVKAARSALSEGKSFGLVGDQAFPESSYVFTFLGQRAYGASTPALLAYRHNVPIIPTLNHRRGLHQEITYLEPIYPDTSKPLKEEATRMMNIAMKGLEDSIRRQPEDWMWQHNRFKRPMPFKVLKPYRYETVLIIHPQDPKKCAQFEEALSIFYALYPEHNLSHLVSYERLDKLTLPTNHKGSAEAAAYTDEASAKQHALKYKLVFDFSGFKSTRRYYTKGAAITYVRPKELKARILDRLKTSISTDELFTHFQTYLILALFEGDTLCLKTASSILESSKKIKRSLSKERKPDTSEPSCEKAQATPLN